MSTYQKPAPDAHAVLEDLAEVIAAAYKERITIIVEGEPVAWRLPKGASFISAAAKKQNPITFVEYTEPLYAHPQPVSGAADPVGLPTSEQTGPVSAAPTLTDAEIWALQGMRGWFPQDHYRLVSLVREVEAAIHAKASA